VSEKRCTCEFVHGDNPQCVLHGRGPHYEGFEQVLGNHRVPFGDYWSARFYGGPVLDELTQHPARGSAAAMYLRVRFPLIEGYALGESVMFLRDDNMGIGLRG
jgi:hypothetical protein